MVSRSLPAVVAKKPHYYIRVSYGAQTVNRASRTKLTEDQAKKSGTTIIGNQSWILLLIALISLVIALAALCSCFFLLDPKVEGLQITTDDLGGINGPGGEQFF